MSDALWSRGSCMWGFPVHSLPELAQTHVHQVSDTIQPSHPLSSPSPAAFSLSQHQGLFYESVLHIRWPKYWSFSFSILPMHTQDWFSGGLTGLISFLSKGLSRVFSSTSLESINSSVLSLLYSPTLTSVHEYWKNHSWGVAICESVDHVSGNYCLCVKCT